MKTDDHTVYHFSRNLRLGNLTSEYAPDKAADLIDALRRERDDANERIRELETTALPSTTLAERNGYAKGFTAAKRAAAQMLADSNSAAAVANLQPNFALATEAA